MKVYQTLKNYLTIVARCPNHKAAMYVMDSIIGWLRSVKEDKGADWLVDYWSGERGLWNIGAAGVSCPNTNCGVESGWGRIRKSVCAGLKNSTFSQFMTIFLNYETDQSADDMFKHKLQGSIFSPDVPILTRKTWTNVCKMTCYDFRLMTVGIYATDSIFKRKIEAVNEIAVKSGVPFIRAAISITLERKKSCLNQRDALTLIFPADSLIEMFVDEPQFFQSEKYLANIGKSLLCSLFMVHTLT